MSNAGESVVAQEDLIRAQQETKNLLAAAKRLLGEGKLLNSLSVAAAKWRADLRKIAEGSSLPLVIAAVGTKNSGKSTVLRALVNNAGIRERIPCGIAPAGGTRRLIWVGPEGPRNPIAEKEEVLKTGPDDLAKLGKTVTLLDVPGFDDDSDGLSVLARDAVLAARVKILVMRSKELEAVSVRRWARYLGKGSAVLPVIIGAPGDHAGEDCLRQWRTRNAGDLGEAALADPVWIPFDDGTDGDALSERIREAVQSPLRSLLESMPNAEMLAQEQMAAEWRRFHHEVAAILRPIRDGLGHTLERWQEKRNEVLRQSICDMLGEREAAETVLRMDWRLRMTGGMNGFFFPQKAALTLLIVTGGSWDRLTMGTMGSVPSFLMAVAGGIGNMRRHRRMKSSIDRGLADRLEMRGRELLTEATRELDGQLAQVLRDSDGVAAPKHTPANPTFSWRGVDELKEWFRDLWKEKMEASVKAGSGVSRILYGVLGTGIFWCFLFGPLYALYSTFFGVWGAPDLALFPDRGWGALGMAILLAILPIVLLAMAQLISRPGRKQVRRLFDDLSDDFKREVEARSEDGRLLLELNHPRLNDLNRLTEWLAARRGESKS